MTLWDTGGVICIDCKTTFFCDENTCLWRHKELGLCIRCFTDKFGDSYKYKPEKCLIDGVYTHECLTCHNVWDCSSSEKCGATKENLMISKYCGACKADFRDEMGDENHHLFAIRYEAINQTSQSLIDGDYNVE